MKNSMTYIAWFFLGWSAFMATAQAASFDCEKASTKIEKIVCGNVELSKLDEDLSRAYKAAMQSDNNSESTRQAQKKWIKERNNCQDTDCVILAYRTRISELTSSSSSTNSANVSGSKNVREIVTSTKATILTAAQAKRPEYVYVVHPSSGNVSAYLINAATGTLTPVPGSPFAAGRMPSSFTVNPAGTFAYVTNSESRDISAYRINAANGALTPVPGSPFAAGKEIPALVAFNPAGTFAYVEESPESTESARQGAFGDVLAYRINTATGALTPVPGGPFAAGWGEDAPYFVAVNPAGTIAYVNDTLAYRINADTGALAPVPDKQPVFFSVPNSIMSNTVGTLVYAYDNVGPRDKPFKITAYRVNTTTGGLTPISDSSLGTDGAPNNVTVNPTGTLLYVANTVSAQNSSVTAFRINATTGALTPVPGGPFVAAKGILYITINPSGTVAFVVTCEERSDKCSILVYHINATTGALTPSTSNSSSAVTIEYEDPPITIIQP